MDPLTVHLELFSALSRIFAESFSYLVGALTVNVK